MIRTLATLIVFAVAATAAAAETYRSYANERFGATADVPASWRSDPPPANGDGLIVRSPDGNASITVSGSLNIADNVKDAMQEQGTPNNGEAVTYRKAGKRDVTLSGTKGDRIFYRKSILVCGDRIWNSIHLEYPARDKKQYDALVTRVAKSLRGGRSEQIAGCR